MAEDDLQQRIKAGDRDALGEYIHDHSPQLLAFINRRMSDGLKKKVDADDILQELTISCLNAIDSVDLGDREPMSWLFQQAERRIIDAHRRHFTTEKRSAGKEVGLNAKVGGADGGSLGDLIALSMTSPSQAFSRDQREFHLIAALESLPEEGREALRLRYLEGLSSKEIAEQIGKTDGATRVLLSRSLKKLEDVLGENNHFQTLIAAKKQP